MLNAATDSKDLQIVAEEAKMSGTVILILDEIHRLDKNQTRLSITSSRKWSHYYDYATTENPYISITQPFAVVVKFLS